MKTLKFGIQVFVIIAAFPVLLVVGINQPKSSKPVQSIEKTQAKSEKKSESKKNVCLVSTLSCINS